VKLPPDYQFAGFLISSEIETHQKRQRFGVRRLDAALVSGGLTPLDCGRIHAAI
jgi:hypothetical protein